MNKTDLANAMQEEFIIRKGFAEIGHPDYSTVYARIWAKINTFTKTADIHINMQVQKSPGDTLLHTLIQADKVRAALDLSKISIDQDLTEVIPVYQVGMSTGLSQSAVTDRMGYCAYFLNPQTNGCWAIQRYKAWATPRPTEGWYSVQSGDEYIINIYNANVTF